jgi:hypothetical protein
MDLVSTDNYKLPCPDLMLDFIDLNQHPALSDNNHRRDIVRVSNERLPMMRVEHHQAVISRSAPAFPERAG